HFGPGRARLRDGMRGHTRRTVAQEDDNATAFLLEALQRGPDRTRAAEDIAEDVGPMQTRQYALAVADAAVDEGHVLDGVEGGDIGVTCERADLALHREFADALDQLVAYLSVGDEVGDGDLLELMALGKGRDRRPPHHRAVVIHQLREDPDRRQAREPAQIDAGLGMSRAHQHAAVLGNQREDMARPHEIRRAGIAVGKRAYRVTALLRRNAGGEAVPYIDRNRESGAERRVVRRDHGIE